MGREARICWQSLVPSAAGVGATQNGSNTTPPPPARLPPTTVLCHGVRQLLSPGHVWRAFVDCPDLYFILERVAILPKASHRCRSISTMIGPRFDKGGEESCRDGESDQKPSRNKFSSQNSRIICVVLMKSNQPITIRKFLAQKNIFRNFVHPGDFGDLFFLFF